MFPLESSEHMIFRQTQRSWITIINRQPLPLEKQSLISSQFKTITKKWQKIWKSHAKAKIPSQQHRETAVRLGKATKKWCQILKSNAQTVTCRSTCLKTSVCVSWGGGQDRNVLFFFQDRKEKKQQNTSKLSEYMTLLTENFRQRWDRARVLSAQ